MREKLIELCYKSTLDMPLSLGLANDLIKGGVTIQKWIPVSERLPEAHRLVLCRWTRGIGASYGFARYQHEGVWYVLNEGMPEVTHWMPLPEPPKGE